MTLLHEAIPQPTIRDAFEGRSSGFRVYMRAVDAAIGRQTGSYLTADDLPDFDYRSAYEDQIEPDEIAAEALAEAGWDADEGTDSGC